MKRMVVGSWPCMAVLLLVLGCSPVTYSLHFDKSRSLNDVRNAVGATCEQIDPKGKEFECDDGGVVFTVKRAFDEAYRIREKTGAERVEPLFDVWMPEISDSDLGFCGRGSRDQDAERGDLFAGSHYREAREYDQWSLKQIRAPQAWAKIRDRFCVAEGREAEGVWIAHIDTGYTKHPEIWQEGPDNPIAAAKGRNYFRGFNEDPKDPVDPRIKYHLIDIPGHGTGSASVIVSPAGCQLQGEGVEGCVNGVAPGAKIIPLRVHTSVAQFDTRNLARAIRDVAEGRVEGKENEKPQLVSIAMGGPPTKTLRNAVKRAEENGVLIVAASGNYVGIVVWPARFRSTIAVAATNVHCEPWKYSSCGKHVAISAPGESVWRAQWKGDNPVNGMSKGTTFATGHTAGAAALWMVWNKDDLETWRKRGLVTRVFRDDLWACARRPQAGSNPPETYCHNVPWDSENYGNGILDAFALLRADRQGSAQQPKLRMDLDAVGKRKEAEMELEILPLFSSLYPAENRNTLQVSNRITSDYQSLFGSTRKDREPLSALARYETEIMYYYTMNKEVRNSLEAVARGQVKAADARQVIRQALKAQDVSEELRSYLHKTE